MFLTVVTRCHPERPFMQAVNEQSLAAQTCGDWRQIKVQCGTGGVAHANEILSHCSPLPNSDYVMILDDDDLLVCPDAVAILKETAHENDMPSVIVFKADHAELGILPSREVWGVGPRMGHIGSCDFIVSEYYWKRHIPAFNMPECGDYWFLRAIWDHNPKVVWLDKVLAGVQRISKGAPE